MDGKPGLFEEMDRLKPKEAELRAAVRGRRGQREPLKWLTWPEEHGPEYDEPVSLRSWRIGKPLMKSPLRGKEE